MIGFAPITRLVDWLTTDVDWRTIHRRIPSPLGLAALEVAKREVGNGEEGGNNIGPHLDRYRGGQGAKGSWCAAFIFYCILTASIGRGRPCPVKRTHGARKLFRRCVAAGWLVDYADVQPGDVVCWARGPEGSWQAQIGIVSVVVWDRDGEPAGFKYIAGNEGRYPSKVEEHEGHRRRLIGFARVS